MKVGIIGYGSIGQRHASNITALGCHEVMVYDIHAVQVPYKSCKTLSELWAWKPDAVLICTPPETHFDLTVSALLHGAHCFVEKPLATGANAAQKLAVFAAEKRLTLACGYQLLACPSVQAFPRDWKHLAIADKQDMSQWPTPTYRRDMLSEYSHELSLALFWADAFPEKALIEWLGLTACRIKLSLTDGRTVWIDLSMNQKQYFRGASSDRGEWTFSAQENDAAYREELRAFLAGTPYGTVENAVQTMQLLEMLT